MKLDENNLEIRSYLSLVQRLYACAFADDDTTGMLETSNDLSLAYAALGNEPLAVRWADEYLRHALPGAECR